MYDTSFYVYVSVGECNTYMYTPLSNIHACIHTHVRTHTHTHTHIHTHAHKKAQTHTNTHTHIDTHTNARTHTRTRSHTRTHMRTHTHKRVRTHTQMYVYVCKNFTPCGQPCSARAGCSQMPNPRRLDNGRVGHRHNMCLNCIADIGTAASTPTFCLLQLSASFAAVCAYDHYVCSLSWGRELAP